MKTRILLILGILTFGFGIKNASAHTYVWIGTTSTSWLLYTNWTCDGATNTNILLFPGSLTSGTTDAVVIGNGTSFTNLPTLATVGTTTIGSLSVGSSTSTILTLTSNLTVNGSVTVGNSGFTFSGGGLLTATSFSASGAVALKTPLTNTGDTYFSNSAGLTSSSVGIITGTTFTIPYGCTATYSFGAAATFSGAITISNGGTSTFSGGSLVKAASMATSNPTNLNTPLTITGATGDINIGNNSTFTSNSAGVINGYTFTNAGSGTITIGAAATLSSTFSMAYSSALTSNTSSTITAAALTLSGNNTVNLSSPLIVSGLISAGNGATFTCSSAATISAGNITFVYGNTLTTSASVTVNSGGTFSVTSSNITTNNTSATISAPNFTTSASGTNTFSLLGAANITTLLTISAGTNVFTTTNSSLLTAAAVQVSGATFDVNMPLTVTGALTTASGSNITSNSSGVINAGSMSITGSSINLSATSTTSGNVNFLSGTTSVTGTPLFKAGTATVTAGTLTLNEPLTSTGLFTLASGTTLTGNNIAVINAGSMSITAATVSLQATATTTSSDILFVSGTTSYTNSALTTSAGNVNLQAGTLTFSGNVSATSNFITASSSTLNATISTLGATALQIAGTYNVNANCVATTTSASSYISKGMTLSNAIITFTGAGTIAISGTTTFGYITGIQIGTSSLHTSTVNFSAGASITSNNNTITISNYGNLNFNGTSSSGVTCNLANQNSIIYNYSPAIATATYTTFTFSANTSGFNNTGTFTVSGVSTINLNGYEDYITNSGTFIAGLSNSSCTINLDSQDANSTTGADIYNSNVFILGSTSSINFTGTGIYGMAVDNAGTFTLMSDSYGSAAFGTITQGENQSVQGQYNVQRFVSGGSTASNRGYRILTSPVNTSTISSPSSTTSNPISLNTLKNSYTVNGTAYPGIFIAGSGGTGGGFSIANTYPTIYFYKEYLVNSNTTFTSGRNVGVTSIGSTTATLTDGSTYTLNAGNGYLVFFVGPSTRTTGASSTTPVDSYVTNVGYINQGNVQVYLWYTPYNGASSSGTAGNLSFNSALTTAQGGSGFNMLGNPYACTINLATVISDNSSTIDNIYLINRNNTSGQTYQAYTASGTSAPTAGYALSGEGFLAHAKTYGQSLTFKETEKVVAQQLTGTGLPLAIEPQKGINTIGSGSRAPRALISGTGAYTLTGMYVKLVQDTTVYDYCGVYFGKQWSNAFGDDAIDIDPPSGQVYMASQTSDGINVSVNHMADYTKGSRVKLFVNTKTDGLYKLNVEDIRNIDTALYSVFLVDNYKNDSLDMTHYGTYAFNVLKADTNSFGGNRFVLVIEQKPLPPYELASFTGQKISSGVQLDWKTYNEGNYTGFVLQKQTTGGQYEQLDSLQSNSASLYSYVDTHPVTGNNVYRLLQDGINGNITYSAPITINYSSLTAGGVFTVYPNPAKELVTFSINSTTTNTPNYTANIYNTAGELMGRRTVSSSTWTEDVTSYKPGTYIIQLKASTGDTVGQSKFVKTN